jgi:dipeptidyl aminopeptidase/acylaminoacyl peptidase
MGGVERISSPGSRLKQQPFVDPARIATYVWSYGGL